MHLKKIIAIAIVSFSLSCSIGCSRTKSSSPENAEHELKYEQSDDIFANPERGFIHNLEVHSLGTPLNSQDLRAFKAEKVSMILRLYYLEDFKDKPISENELLLIRSDMSVLRNEGFKCVLRFAYTDDMTVADAPFSIIEQHLDQLKVILEENKDVIAFVQAGLIGAWGEWHSSSNGLATVDNERKVLDKLFSVLPSDIMVQVRTPGAKQKIFNTIEPISNAIAYTNDERARVGHHNDCFMASSDDYGTYTNVEADKNYISKEGLFVPTGGETCPPQNGGTSCATATSTMKLLRWTYLNLDWYKPTIDAWKASGCFEELQRNLGYRLTLKTAKFPNQVAVNEDLKININIGNVGYAPLYNYKSTHLVLKNNITGEMQEIDLTVDLRECKPGAEFNIDKTIKTTGIAVGTYKLYLKIADKSENLRNKMGYSIRLANSNVWEEENGGMNNLNHNLKIGE